VPAQEARAQRAPVTSFVLEGEPGGWGEGRGGSEGAHLPSSVLSACTAPGAAGKGPVSIALSRLVLTLLRRRVTRRTFTAAALLTLRTRAHRSKSIGSFTTSGSPAAAAVAVGSTLDAGVNEGRRDKADTASCATRKALAREDRREDARRDRSAASTRLSSISLATSLMAANFIERYTCDQKHNTPRAKKDGGGEGGGVGRRIMRTLWGYERLQRTA
jgi:hypothetical protein